MPTALVAELSLSSIFDSDNVAAFASDVRFVGAGLLNKMRAPAMLPPKTISCEASPLPPITDLTAAKRPLRDAQ